MAWIFVKHRENFTFYRNLLESKSIWYIFVAFGAISRLSVYVSLLGS